MFQLNQNKQKTNRNSLIESIFWYFSENVGLFRFVSKQFCLFRLFRYRFETPKQAKFFSFSFMKQTETQAKQIVFWFVSIRTEFFFYCFEDTLVKSIERLHVGPKHWTGGWGERGKEDRKQKKLWPRCFQRSSRRRNTVARLTMYKTVVVKRIHGCFRGTQNI